MSTHEYIERAFERWGYAVCRYRWQTISVVAVITLFLGSWIPFIRTDNSTEGFLHSEDPAIVQYDDFKTRFGRDDRVIVLLRPRNVFSISFLEKLRAIHDQIEAEVPYVEEVTSLINARHTRGEADELVVEELVADHWPENASDIATIRRRALSNPVLINNLISETTDYTAIVIKPFTYSTLNDAADALEGFDEASVAAPDAPEEEPEYLTESEGKELIRALEAVLDAHASPDIEVHYLGGPAMAVSLADNLNRDVTVFMTAAFLLIAALLYLLFRRISGVVLALTIVQSSLLATFGIMVMLDVPMSTSIGIVPAFLLVVGICDSVHILAIVYQRLSLGSGKYDSIAYALGHSGLAVAMTSVTTAVGLISFVAAELAPIAHLGVIAPIGVLLAMVYSLTLLPALLAVTPLKMRYLNDQTARDSMISRSLSRLGEIACDRPYWVLAVTAAMLVVGAIGVSKARFSHDGIRWFPEGDPLRVATEIIDDEFKGAHSLEVLIDTHKENGIHDPETLQRIERAMRYAETLQVDGKPLNRSLSIVDILKENHRALNENRADYYRIPDDRLVIAQEFLLFENSGSDDLEDWTDSQFSTARITVRSPSADAMLYPDFIQKLRGGLTGILGDIDFELTGGTVLFSQTFKNVIISMRNSYLIALIVITPIMILLIGSLKRGLLAMVPNLIPVFMVIGLMGWLDIPLDASTLMVGSIIIGLAVDDTIHFMHKFNRYYEISKDARYAVQETLLTTGTALFFTSLALSAGFAVFLLSYMLNGYYFGLLASFATVVAFLADILVAPALMVLVTRNDSTSS